MSRSHRVKVISLAITAVVVMSAWAYAEVGAAATNNLPNPYRPDDVSWGQLPAGIEWGQVISVDPDGHGHVWVFHRKDPAILEFDSSGKLIASFGSGVTRVEVRAVEPGGASAYRAALRADLAAHVLKHLARFKLPREFVFVDDLPRTALGKVQHFRLKEMSRG